MNFNTVKRVHQCLMCSSSNNNIDFPECCIGNYLPAGRTVCSANLASCSTMNSDGNCRVCNLGYYLTNGHCCQSGFFYQNGCVAITEPAKCQQIVLSEANKPKNCSLCSASFEEYQITDGRCCQKGFIYLRNGLLDNCFPYDSLFKRCLAFDSASGKCLECSAGFDLSRGICCPKGQHTF